MIGFRTILPDSASSRSSVTQSENGLNPELGAVEIRQSGIAHRTLDDVRDQFAQELAVRIITKAEVLDDVRIGVAVTFSKADDEKFLRKVAAIISQQMTLTKHLFAIATMAEGGNLRESTLIICGSSEDYVQRAVLLSSSKFIGRIISATTDSEKQWIATIHDVGSSSYDEDALWDVVRKSARRPFSPLLPPPGSRSIDDILADARSKLQRISPMQAYEELRETEVGAPTFLVDIRPAAQREAQGGIHGSLIIERNVLEWRFDPRSNARLAIADRYDLRIIIFCQEGYTSSLAAYSLQQLGLLNATDIIGGYQAWKDLGLPVDVERPITKRPEIRSLVSLAGSVV